MASFADSLLKVKAKINGVVVDAVACSFRGAHFFVKNNQESGFGRTIVSKKIAFSGTAVHEDLGENVSSLSMNIFLYGLDCDTQKQELIKACNKKGAAELTHPWLGKLNVICKNLSFLYGTERLGYIEGSISFEKVSTVSERTVQVNAATQTNNSALAFRQEKCTIFSQVFDAGKMAKNTVDKVTSYISKALDYVFEARESLNGVAEFLNAVNKLKAETSLLLRSPEILANRVRELMEASAETFNFRSEKNDVDEYIAIAMLQDPNDEYSGYSRMFYDLIRQSALTMVAESLVKSSFASAEEARDYQQKVSDAFESVLEKTDDVQTYIGLNDVLANCLTYLRDVIANSAYVVERDVVVTDNALSLCYDTYRNVDRVEEIMDRNQMFNGMFVMPGKVKVLSK